MATTMRLIAKVALSNSATDVTFSDIPGTYTDLVVLASNRNTNATGGASGESLRMDINGSTANRSARRLGGYDSNIVYSDSLTTTNVGESPAANATSNTFASSEIYIPNYAGSTNKSFSVTSVSENNSSTNWAITTIAGLWSSTSAITSLKFYTSVGSLASGSSFFLYGITKA